MLHFSQIATKHNRFCGKKTCSAYFGMKLGNQGQNKSGFNVFSGMEEATEWLCGFCLVNISGCSSKTASFISYPNLPSAMRPAPHLDEMPPLIFFQLMRDERAMVFCLQMHNILVMRTLKITRSYLLRVK